MVLLLVAWAALSVVLGLVVGAAIHRADVMDRRTRPPMAAPVPAVHMAHRAVPDTSRVAA